MRFEFPLWPFLFRLIYRGHYASLVVPRKFLLCCYSPAQVVRLIRDIDESTQTDSDGRTRQRSIGIIVLGVGREPESQSKKLEKKLRDHPFVGDELYRKHEIRCGGPADFQGDEKDIVLAMLMSKQLLDNINIFRWEQAINVAVSRARERFHLFHQLTPGDIVRCKTEEDPRRKLIRYCERATIAFSNSQCGLDKLASFAKYVAEQLIAAGVEVRTCDEILPEEWRDKMLVVEGAKRMIAIVLNCGGRQTLDVWRDESRKWAVLCRVDWRVVELWQWQYEAEHDAMLTRLYHVLFTEEKVQRLETEHLSLVSVDTSAKETELCGEDYRQKAIVGSATENSINKSHPGTANQTTKEFKRGIKRERIDDHEKQEHANEPSRDLRISKRDSKRHTGRKYDIPVACAIVPSVQLVVSAEEWFKRSAEQTRKIKDARSKFQEKSRDQISCCEVIERSVGDLRRLLSEAVGPKKYTDPKPWNKQLDLMDEHFQERQKLSNIIVVGDTGAGKSSLLNAILDEWSVLPTNCSGRACTGLPLAFFFFVKIVQYLGQKCADFAESDANTASVIELEYDADAAGKDQPYSATVEFVSKEDWHQELQTLAEEQEVRSANLPKSFLVRIFFRAHACLSPPQVDGEEAGEDETCNASQVSGTTAYAATSTSARIDADFN